MLPEVGSTTVCPGLRVPAPLGVLDDRDRQAVLDRAQRVEGLALDVHGHAGRREAVDRTTGVLPIVPRMLSWIMGRSSRKAGVSGALDVASGSSRRSVGYASFMRTKIHVIACLFAVCLFAPMVVNAAAPRTMRVDYFHTGNATEERFSLDRIVLEPLPWPGNPKRPVDDTNLGKYLFEVIDRASNRVLYSRGFASVYGEWETTGGGERALPHLLRVAAVPGARGARPDLAPEARCAERVPRGLGPPRRPARTSSSTAPLRPRPARW